ncbi:hypothetical protein ACLK19_11660 [Escherichia coli]
MKKKLENWFRGLPKCNRQDSDITITTWRNGIATENKWFLGNNQSVVRVSSCFTPHSCANLMIWQTTWERHYVAGN